MACDVSRGDSSDYSTIQVLDAITLEQVCEYRGKIFVDLFPYVINAIGRYYNNAYCAIEANNFGLGVALDVKNKLGYPHERIFHSKNVKSIYVRPKDYEVGEGEIIPGFQTTSKTRPLIVASLITHLREGLLLNSKRLVSEFENFVIKDNGKAEHENGYNDDLIIAIAIALFMYDTEHKNIIATKGMYKAMISAISISTNPISGIVKKDGENIDLSKVGGSSIFFSNGNGEVKNPGQSKDDNDLSWIYK